MAAPVTRMAPMAERTRREDPQAVRSVERLTPAQSAELCRRRRSRNRALMIVLLALVALFYALTISRLSDVGDPQQWSRPGAIAPSR